MTARCFPGTVFTMDAYEPASAPPPLVMPQKLPGYSKVMAIVDLVMSVARGMAGLLGIVGMLALSGQLGQSEIAEEIGAPMWQLIGEVVTALLVGVFGVIANILLLMEKRAGISIAWLSIIFTIASIAVSLLAVKSQIPPDANESTKIGVYLGGTIIFVFRLGLLIAYIVGVNMAARWFRERATNPPGI